MSTNRGSESNAIILIGLAILLAFVIGSIWYEYHNPCLEWGPRYVTKIDPETGYVHYSQRCLKRTN